MLQLGGGTLDPSFSSPSHEQILLLKSFSKSICGGFFFFFQLLVTAAQQPNVPRIILKVCIITLPVVIISVGELGVLFTVWDSSEGRMVVEAGLEDLVHYFLCVLLTYFSHRQNGQKSTGSDALLSRETVKS